MSSDSMRVRTGGRSTSSASSTPSLKLLVARSQSGTERVVYAEADKHAADFLFSLLGLPISTVGNILSTEPMVGCLANLYGSVQTQTLPDRYICHSDARAARFDLLAGRLIPLINASSSSSNRRRSSRHIGFVVERRSKYTVSDNLNITPSGAGGSFRERIVLLGPNEGIKILKASLVSQTVLTDVFLRA